jgi:mismatch-specific thymine-DNA glycosylase
LTFLYTITIINLFYFIFVGKCLYLSGLTPEPMTADDDYKLLQNGIGFTNMVERATKGSADLTRKEIKEGLFSISI